ncbi:MAG: hypothetical protein RLY97_924 [Pseudomonadota bacterium]|jgi:cytochrome c556
MKRTFWIASAAALVLAGFGGAAVANSGGKAGKKAPVAKTAPAPAMKPAEVIEARHANFKVMGKGFKAIRDQLMSPSGSMDIVKENAVAIDGAAVKVAGFFPKGSGAEAGVKTEALPAIWEKPTDFKAASDKLVAAAAGLKAAAASGDMANVKAAIPALGGACKGCHDSFKAKD